jgi:hypothetical protein
MIKKSIIFILVIATVLTGVTVTAGAAFSDVPGAYAYKTDIEFCQSKGYLTGTSATTFDPGGKLTRGQLVVVWCRLLSLRSANPGFTDITPLKNYYDAAAIVISSLGILNGTGATTFSPDLNVTREQLAMITMRTYDLGVANKNDYQNYTDSNAISAWAQDAVSACVNAKVFEGLYDAGKAFQPQSLVTRGEICKLLVNVTLPPYRVSVGPLSGGTITAIPSIARQGTIIRLIVKPDTGKQLKAGTLLYNGSAVSGTSFIMPASDVVVTAEFEDIPAELASIEVTNTPSVTTYFIGEPLDLTGMTVTARYSNNAFAVVTGQVTTDPASGTVLNTEGSIPVTVSYSEGGITKTTTFTVTVSSNPGT